MLNNHNFILIFLYISHVISAKIFQYNAMIYRKLFRDTRILRKIAIARFVHISVALSAKQNVNRRDTELVSSV